MAKNNYIDRYYAIPSDLLHNWNKDGITKLYGRLSSSDKTREINIYSNEIDWKVWPTNIALLLMFGGVGFLLSSANFYVALFTVFIFAPYYHWRKVIGVISYLEVPRVPAESKPLSEIGKEALHDHLVETGQIKE